LEGKGLLRTVLPEKNRSDNSENGFIQPHTLTYLKMTTYTTAHTNQRHHSTQNHSY